MTKEEEDKATVKQLSHKNIICCYCVYDSYVRLSRYFRLCRQNKNTIYVYKFLNNFIRLSQGLLILHGLG